MVSKAQHQETPQSTHKIRRQEGLPRASRSNINLNAILTSHKLAARDIELVRFAIASVGTPCNPATINLRRRSRRITRPGIDRNLRSSTSKRQRRPNAQGGVAARVVE